MLRRLIVYCFFTGLLCQHIVAFESDRLIKGLKPTGSITDNANLLPARQEQKLRTILDNLEKQTGAALVVVTLPSMKGGQIEDFTNRLFEEWGVGQAGKDNGVMLLVAVKERKMRIEVGYGLEGTIPDGLAGSIRDQYVLPYFKNGQMATGIESGALALANLVAKHYKIEISEKPAAPPRGRQKRNWPIIVFVLVFIIIQIISRLRGAHSNSGRYHRGSSWYVSSSSGGFGGGGGSSWYVNSSGGGFGGGSSFGGGGSFGGFGGGMSGGGGASGGW